MSAPSDPSQELLDRAHRNLVEHAWLLGRIGPRPRRKEWTGSTAVGNALPTDTTNVLYVGQPPPDVPRMLLEAREFFGKSTPWRVCVPTRLQGGVGPSALAAGMRRGPVVPRMVMDPIPERPTVPSELTIRPVTRAAELEDFILAGGRGFRIPSWILRIALPFVPAPSRPGSPSPHLYVGYRNGKPVATAGGMTSEGLVGIFFVSTVPEARRRGYGAALTWAAIEGGRRESAVASFLLASEMGASTYERMGYRRVDDYFDWVQPVSGPNQLRALFRVLGLSLRHRNRPDRLDP